MQQTLDITSKSQTGVIIACVTLITAISTLLNGAITVALPTLARELAIPPSLLLWPTSIQSLVTGCTLLICGSIADSVGSRLMYLTGSILQTGAILGCGLSRIGTQLIVFRGLGGIALSFCLPSAVSIITSSFTGKRRDMAFASMGGGQPVGFSIGLALGGVLTDTIGWRWAFHLAAILNAVIFSIALWGLPKSIDSPSGVSSWATKVEKLKHEIDWIGALIASASLAMLSYAFATITGNTADIKEAKTLATLVIAFALIPLFVFWVGRQERLGRPAIIPNSLWRNKVFTTICLGVFLTWGSFNALETMLTFFFQEVQGLSAIQTSLRFLPAPVAGVVANVAIGLLVHRVAANYLVLFGCGISVVAPLVMAFAKPQSSFWSTGLSCSGGFLHQFATDNLTGFLANVFNPTGADSLFTISNLLITSSFPSKTQALAGGVFNTQVASQANVKAPSLTRPTESRKLERLSGWHS